MTTPTPPSSTPAPRTPELELTVRAVLTGALLGGILSLCNIYSGLRIGWGFNMSITAALLGWGFWSAARAGGARPFGKLENNLNQTGASAGASISSAGLVSAIPAWTMMTHETLSWGQLAAWTFCIGMLGVAVGIGLRRQMLEIDRLPFASGIASAETLDKIHGGGSGSTEARGKLYALLASLGIAGAWKVVLHAKDLSQLKVPGTIGIGGGRSASFFNLTLGLDLSPLMVAVGALGSVRTGFTLLAGSLFSWGVLAPWVIANGWCQTGADDPGVAWFGPVVKWLLWPGVAMMVSSSLTSVAFSWRSFVAAFRGGKAEGAKDAKDDAPVAKGPDVSRREYQVLMVVVTIGCALGQHLLFGIPIAMGVFATLVTFALATVAARVSGETTVTPVGAMGKVTQLLFGIIRPGDATANLMTANVTGGAASQTADLLHDLKAGLLIGASPRAQAIAQSAGVLGGALLGSAAYLILIPDPEHMLLTDEWPAPAVVTWRAVAELFAEGLEAMPQGSLEAMAIGGAVGVVLALLERLLPEKARVWVPSPASLGLSFVIQAWTCFSLFLGSLVGWALRRWAPAWSEQYLTPLASGVIAGESLMGVGIAVHAIVTGGGGGH
jgi:OPT family oligopeptide transporter